MPLPSRARPPKKPKMALKMGQKRQYLTDNFEDLPDDIKALKNGHVYLFYVTHSKSPAQTVRALVDRYGCVKSAIKLTPLLNAMKKFSDATSKTTMTRFKAKCCESFHLSEKEPQPSPGQPSGKYPFFLFFW